MATPIYIAVNQTASDIFLRQLRLTCPGSGQVNLSDFNTAHAIQDDEELLIEITADRIRINNGTTTLSNAESLRYAAPLALATTAPADVTRATSSVGTSTDVARQDHKHDITSGTPGAIAAGDTASAGSATSVALSDHRHSSPATWEPTAHASHHITGGSDVVDADRADITWAPTFYTRTTDALAPSTSNLTAHLKGINAALNPATIGSNMIVVYASDETTSTTTSTTFQTKLTLSYTVPVAGNFMLFWDAHLSSTSASTDFEGRINQDSGTIVNLLSGAVPANNAEFSWGGHRRFALTAAAHTFAVQYRKVSGSGTIGIQEVHLSLWRIG